MAGTVNKVILIGNLGKDPEVRKLENGALVANFPIATSETYTDKNTNERKEITDWHNIVVWRGLAEVVDKYVKKGMKVYIEGKIKTRSYQDKEGQMRYVTEIVADELSILSRPEEQNNQAKAPYSNQGTPNNPSPMGLDSSPQDDGDLPF